MCPIRYNLEKKNILPLIAAQCSGVSPRWFLLHTLTDKIKNENNKVMNSIEIKDFLHIWRIFDTLKAIYNFISNRKVFSCR